MRRLKRLRIKLYISEWYQDYKLPSLFVCAPSCSGKCCTEAGASRDVCQNSRLAYAKTIDVNNTELIDAYESNPITRSVVVGGLEPFDSAGELIQFVADFRRRCRKDMIVIYTGFTEDEVKGWMTRLKEFPNIVIKFGRYIPGQQPHYDEVLGVNLASDNQYAVKIS